MNEQLVQEKIQTALAATKAGHFHADLRFLYQSPIRAQVPWLDFPAWARPDDPVEGCHEG